MHVLAWKARVVTLRLLLTESDAPDRGRFLVTGASATGKTTVGELLERAGYLVIEADEALAGWVDPATARPAPAPGPDWDGSAPEWRWEAERVDQLFASMGPGPLFVCGGAENEHRFLDRFDGVLVLVASDSVLKKRLRRRGRGTGAWASAPLKRNARFRAGGEPGVLIDADRSLVMVARALLRAAAHRIRPHGNEPLEG